MTDGQFRKAFLLVLVASITVAFVAMLRTFLLTILVAAIFSGLAYPLYARLLGVVRGHRPIASALTLLLVTGLVVGPLFAIAGVVVSQAVRVTDSIRPVVERFLNEPTYIDQQLQRIPGIERIGAYREQIVTSTGAIVGVVGRFLAGSLSDAATGTVTVPLSGRNVKCTNR